MTTIKLFFSEVINEISSGIYRLLTTIKGDRRKVTRQELDMYTHAFLGAFIVLLFIFLFTFVKMEIESLYFEWFVKK